MSETKWKCSKTVPGAPLQHVSEIEDAVRTGSWIYHADRPYHPRFIASMQFSVVLQRLRSGQLRWAMDRTNPGRHHRSISHYLRMADNAVKEMMKQ